MLQLLPLGVFLKHLFLSNLCKRPTQVPVQEYVYNSLNKVWCTFQWTFDNFFVLRLDCTWSLEKVVDLRSTAYGVL